MKKILAFVLLLSACCHEKTIDRQCLLTNNNIKFWDVVYDTHLYNKAISRVYPCYCYCFDNNNNWNLYEYQRKKKWTQYDTGDVESVMTWYFSSDTTINIGGAVYKIAKFTTDTLILTSKKMQDSTVLVKSGKVGGKVSDKEFEYGVTYRW
jgi:hypothetical protein